MFILLFLPLYFNLTYLRKYAQTPMKILSICLFILQILLIIATVLSGLLLGYTYICQAVTGLLYAAFFTLISMLADTWIHRFAVRSIFVERKARRGKFMVLFITTGFMMVAGVLFNMDLHQWQRPPNIWMQNTCNDQFLGMKSTFLESAILICIPMLVFGTSFAINLDGDIRSDWKDWSIKLKLARL